MADPNEKDLFCRQRIYPDATGIISWSPQSLEDVKDSAVVVVDTNALLVPFGTGKASLDEIGKTYRCLVDQNRLAIPGQVVREFARTRVAKLQELHQQLMRKKVVISHDAYPLLEGLTGYSEMKALENRLEELVRSYRSAVDSVLTEIRRWRWNDPVSVLYAALFNSQVIQDPQFDEVDLTEDLAQRKKNGIPPGYKDAGKEDGGVGDLVIWRTILEVGKNRRTPLLFVSGDQKPDWWHQSEGQPLYPRFELVDEYRRHSGGATLHLLRFADFLDLFGANPVVVEEVRKEEEVIQRSVSESRVPGTDVPSTAPPPQISPDALRRMEEMLKPPQYSPDVLRRMEEALRPPQISPDALRRMEEMLKPPQYSPDVLRRMEETMKATQISPDALRRMEETMKAAQYSPDALRRMEETMKATQISPDALRRMEETMKAAQISPDALRRMEETMKATQISPDALRRMEETMKAAQISPDALRRMEETMKATQISPDALRRMEETMKAAQYSPDALRRMEEMLKPPQISPDALRRMEETMKAAQAQIPNALLRQMEEVVGKETTKTGEGGLIDPNHPSDHAENQ
jgi:rRNA-processing protein FCF1